MDRIINLGGTPTGTIETLVGETACTEEWSVVDDPWGRIH